MRPDQLRTHISKYEIFFNGVRDGRVCSSAMKYRFCSVNSVRENCFIQLQKQVRFKIILNLPRIENSFIQEYKEQQICLNTWLHLYCELSRLLGLLCLCLCYKAKQYSRSQGPNMHAHLGCKICSSVHLE